MRACRPTPEGSRAALVAAGDQLLPLGDNLDGPRGGEQQELPQLHAKERGAVGSARAEDEPSHRAGVSRPHGQDISPPVDPLSETEVSWQIPGQAEGGEKGPHKKYSVNQLFAKFGCYQEYRQRQELPQREGECLLAGGTGWREEWH